MSVRVTVLSERASLGLALTMLVPEWDVDAVASLDGWSNAEVDALVIEASSTEEGLQLRAQLAAPPFSVLVGAEGDDQPVPDGVALLARPFTVAQLRDLIEQVVAPPAEPAPPTSSTRRRFRRSKQAPTPDVASWPDLPSDPVTPTAQAATPVDAPDDPPQDPHHTDAVPADGPREEDVLRDELLVWHAEREANGVDEPDDRGPTPPPPGDASTADSDPDAPPPQRLLSSSELGGVWTARSLADESPAPTSPSDSAAPGTLATDGPAIEEVEDDPGEVPVVEPGAAPSGPSWVPLPSVVVDLAALEAPAPPPLGSLTEVGEEPDDLEPVDTSPDLEDFEGGDLEVADETGGAEMGSDAVEIRAFVPRQGLWKRIQAVRTGGLAEPQSESHDVTNDPDVVEVALEAASMGPQPVGDDPAETSFDPHPDQATGTSHVGLENPPPTIESLPTQGGDTDADAPQRSADRAATPESAGPQVDAVALLAETLNAFDPVTSAIWVPDGAGYWRPEVHLGLRRAESRRPVRADQPLFRALAQNRHGLLLSPADLARGYLSGIPGTWTEDVIAAAVPGRRAACLAIVVVGGDALSPRATRRLVELAAEAGARVPRPKRRRAALVPS